MRQPKSQAFQLVGLVIGLVLMLSLMGCQKQETTPKPLTTPSLSSAPAATKPSESEGPYAKIHFIDTGNSDAILIQQEGHAALIDGGENDDETRVVEYIQGLGIKSLDYVFATHPDADHIGGLDAVISKIPVDKVLVGNGKATSKTYTDFIEAIMNKGLTPSVPLLYSQFPLGEAKIKVVSVANEKDVNNCSLVLAYEYNDHRVLLMGDADQSIEAKIDLNEVGKVDLIKVGHHGSKTSSNKAFIQAVSPQYAVITCGVGNKYGHPNQETLDTLNEFGIEIYRTDQMGNIIFDITKKNILPEEEAAVTAFRPIESNEVVNTKEQGSSMTYKSVEKEEATQESESNKVGREEIVYFTANGKRYHRDPNCSNMKQPIEGTIEEVGSRTPCQKCYN